MLSRRNPLVYFDSSLEEEEEVEEETARGKEKNMGFFLTKTC